MAIEELSFRPVAFGVSPARTLFPYQPAPVLGPSELGFSQDVKGRNC